MSSVGSHVLLMPEDCQGRPLVAHPSYGKVTTVTATTATVRLLTAPRKTVKMPAHLVHVRQVDSREHANGAIGEWLRKAVVGISNNTYIHGQVIAYEEDQVTIRTAYGDAISSAGDLQEVAPVLCLLLGNSQFTAASVTFEELTAKHLLVLDRLIGPSRRQVTAANPTRSIAKLLAGILPPRQHPQPRDSITWINGDSGRSSSVTCRHAVDFAHFIDGDRPVPRGLLPTIGSRFDDDPSQRPAAEEDPDHVQDEDEEMVEGATEDEDVENASTAPRRLGTASSRQDPLDQLEALLGAGHPPTVLEPSTAAHHDTNASDHAKILAAIADDPNLVKFYLSTIRDTSSKRSAATEDTRPPQRRRLESPSDLLAASEFHDRRSKHEFSPSRVQQAIRSMLSAIEYKGKEAMFIVESMISSRATKFKPVPAIIIRIYAFEFGARGLSVMHFVRLDFAARRAWYASASTNLNNFSASVTLPKAARAQTLDDLSNALTVLHVFAEEFMDAETCRLISNSREFVEELRCFSHWAARDVETLTFWFDSVFESYRAAVEHDSRYGSSSRREIRKKLSLQDPDLQSVLYVIQAERYAALMPYDSRTQENHATRQDRQRQPRVDGHRQPQGSRPPPRTPREVIDALPKQGRLSVCMKYLSSDGCSSKSDERCAFPNHAHFIPEKLAPVVYKHINEHLVLVQSPNLSPLHPRSSSITNPTTVPSEAPASRLNPRPRFRIAPGTVVAVRDSLLHRLAAHETIRRHGLVSAFLAANITPPVCLTRPIARADPPLALDADLTSALSSLVKKSSLSLKATIALWRGETPQDPRPNKALDPLWLDVLLHDYPLREYVVDAARAGVHHKFVSPREPDHEPVENHASARRYHHALDRSLSEGQAAGTYLIVGSDAALSWRLLRYSPFGCVPKKDIDPQAEARLIHNLSFFDELSVNCRSCQDDFPTLTFEPVRRIATRIEELAIKHPASTIRMLKGDVKSAFRHIPVSWEVAAHFAGSSGRDLTVIDLSLPFGWTGSPPHYGSFGGGVAFLVARESPRSLDPTTDDNEPFFSFVWVDDHILVEVDRPRRLQLAESALRLSMLAILGPHAINDKKFSGWETELHALGLIWDTRLRIVSMPTDKITKSLLRISSALTSKKVTKHDLAKLLGSLRHVSMCCRAARAFLQRLHGTWKRAPAFGPVRLHDDVRRDLMWIQTLLTTGGMVSVPTSIIAGTSEPAVHLFMDASDEGLCVLYPAAKEYVRVQFDDEERRLIKDCSKRPHEAFSINVRESLSVVFAVLVWGPRWSHLSDGHDRLHVRCWIDNVSAVAWIRRQQSSNIFGQELTRVLSCAEVQFKLHISTEHLQGSANDLADLGSRGCTVAIPEDLRSRIIELQWRSLADTSREQYVRTWVQWCEFCAKYRLSCWLRPDNAIDQSIQLVMFAVCCWKTSDSSTPLRFETIRNKLSHVRWCHQLVVGFRPDLAPPHQLVLDAIRRLSPARRERHAVTIAMLEAIMHAADMRLAQHRVICGAAVLGFFFCLRGSEYLASRGKKHQYCIQVGDISVKDAQGQDTLEYRTATVVSITLRGSKTDQAGNSTTRQMLKSGRAPVCPVFAAILLRLNASLLGLHNQASLCSIDSSTVLSTQAMTRILKKAAANLGQDPSMISTHSLRVGGATAMHAANMNPDAIRLHGRWASDAYRRYVREAAPTTTRIAERMGIESPIVQAANRPARAIGASRDQDLERSGRWL